MWQAAWIDPLYNGVLLPSPVVDELLPVHPAGAAPMTEVAVFAGGCFWGVQAVFQHINGVTSAVSGYAGGDIANPTYTQVASGLTTHAEAVEVTFNPEVVSYGTLLKVFFSVVHDPTQIDRQGPDVGPQYRSEVFTLSTGQADVVKAYIAQLEDVLVYSASIVTKVAPLDRFWRAEDAHQDYVVLHPRELYVAVNDTPKIASLRAMFPDLWRDDPVLVTSTTGA
jgi:peptide-methionine (S)-S-oxide reductase